MASPQTTTSDLARNPETDLADKIAAKRAELAELQRLAREARAAATAKPEPNRIRLTKSTVRALPVPRDRLAVWWDKDLTGFGVRVSPAGRKTYLLQTRTKAGRGVKITLGRADRITTEQAREAAKEHLAAIELRRDPAAELRERRQAERDRRKAATVDQAWQEFAKSYLPGKRAKTVSAYTGWYSRHIKPVVGKTKLADLTSERVKQLHRAVTEGVGPSTANRVLAVLSSLLRYAVEEKLVPVNVARGAVARHHEEERERTMTDAELTRLIAFLDGSDALEARFCEFLVGTGCRRGEALAMRWDDLAGGWWTVPASVSKSKKVVRRPLNQAALDVLAKVERRGARVFDGLSEGRVSKWWQAERRLLDLADLRLHDLRHAAASLAISAGIPLAAVGKLLGHGTHSAAMTKRYAHLSDVALTEASAAVAERLRVLREAVPAGNA